ncbi:hypothetical protein HOG21_05765 [bacterium]|nr:hypothetical protein [bacterium]
MEDIESEEENILNEILDRAIEYRKTQFVVDMMNEYKDKQVTSLKVVMDLQKDDIVIDIREEQEKNKKPLILSDNKILEIPFFEINYKFKDLDQEKSYLFYCEK